MLAQSAKAAPLLGARSSRRVVMKIRVYLATTQGPVLIERISREPAPQSAICLKRTTKVLPVSAGYDAFVRQPSGVVEREFGPFDKGGFRLDVSGEIAAGESWQLGVFVAHALKEAGELAGSDEPFDEVWWLTGEVDNDLNVKAVAHVPDKIRAATDGINSLVESNTPVTLFLAEQNLTAIDRSELPYGIRVVGVSTTAEVVDGVGHATPPPTLELKDQVMPPVPWPERSGGADRSGMGAARRSSAAAVIGASILTLAVVLLAVLGIDLFEQPPPPQPVVVAIAPPPPSPVPGPPAALPPGPQPGATATLGVKGESGPGVIVKLSETWSDCMLTRSTLLSARFQDHRRERDRARHPKPATPSWAGVNSGPREPRQHHRAAP